MKKIKKQSKIKILGGTCGTEKKRQSNESRQKKKTSKVKRRSLSADERDDDNFSPSKPFNGKNQFFPSRGSPLPSLSLPFSPFPSLLSHSLSTGLNYAGFFPHVVLGCLRFKSNLFQRFFLPDVPFIVNENFWTLTVSKVVPPNANGIFCAFQCLARTQRRLNLVKEGLNFGKKQNRVDGVSKHSEISISLREHNDWRLKCLLIN